MAVRPSQARQLESRGQLGFFSIEEMTSVPAVAWTVPRVGDLPDRLAGVVGVDTENCDPELKTRGAGWAWRGGGHVAGYAVAADNFRGYLPVGHEGGENLDGAAVRGWLNHVLADERQVKVFANAPYDVGWMRTDGVEVKGPVIDVLTTEALLDEHRLSYDLGSVARDRVGAGKDESVLKAAARAYGVDPKAGLWKMPPRYAADYAVEDADLPRRIWAVQEPVVEKEGLRRVLDLEHALFPMYDDMRRRGVRIDVAATERYRDQLRGEVAAEVAEVKRLTGVGVEIWEARSVAKMLDALGVLYGRTPRSREPQVGNDLLERAGHPACDAVLRARQKDKLAGTFLEGQILEQVRGGRVHGSIHPLKSDDGGTVTGRLSMSSPNLQFIPARTEEGRRVRESFLPEDGEVWASDDVNQQEVRLLVHFACLLKMPSALEARRRYLEEPGLNYHEFVAGVTGLPYKAAKILNFGIIYGRGLAAVADDIGCSQAEAEAMMTQHAREMPFARGMAKFCKERAADRGYLRTLLGRRQRFPLYEPASWDARDGRMLPLDQARRAWGGSARLVRARTHKALNALIQPSAADQTKSAMLAVWRAGLGRHVLIQVHDELDLSVPDERVAHRVAEVMQDAVQLEVPSKVDVSVGRNWGEAA